MSKSPEKKTYKRPSWLAKSVAAEDELCPECFKVVGVKSRYRLVRLLGKAEDGATVATLTEELGLRQPTVTHHLNALRSVDAVGVESRGRQRVYRLNRNAHCFEECHIPF